VSQFQKGRL